MICMHDFFLCACHFVLYYSLSKQHCFTLILVRMIQSLRRGDSFIVIRSSQDFWIACGLLRMHYQSCHCLELALCLLCILYIATYSLMDWFENATGSFKIPYWDWPGTGLSKIWDLLTETCADAYQHLNITI